jgi:hypothetical protein
VTPVVPSTVVTVEEVSALFVTVSTVVPSANVSVVVVTPVVGSVTVTVVVGSVEEVVVHVSTFVVASVTHCFTSLLVYVVVTCTLPLAKVVVVTDVFVSGALKVSVHEVVLPWASLWQVLLVPSPLSVTSVDVPSPFVVTVLVLPSAKFVTHVSVFAAWSIVQFELGAAVVVQWPVCVPCASVTMMQW